MLPNQLHKAAIFGGTYSYTSRPEPIAGDLRMSWGIAVLLLSLLYSRGKKASFPKLQFLGHSVRVKVGREDVESLLAGNLHASEISVRVEPWLNRAVSFAHALKLVNVDRGRSVALTDLGLKRATEISAQQGLLVEEMDFLKRIGPRLTDKIIEKIWRMEDLL